MFTSHGGLPSAQPRARMCLQTLPRSSWAELCSKAGGTVFSSEGLVVGSASGYTQVNLARTAFLLMRGRPAAKMPNHSEMLRSSWD